MSSYLNDNFLPQSALTNYLRAYGLVPDTLQYRTVESHVNYLSLVQELIPTPEEKRLCDWFELHCDIRAYSVQILQTYLQEAEYEAARTRRKLYRKLIRSTAVSMAGHLSFLVPNYQQVCLETTSKEEVVHYEGITLAEEKERLNPFIRAIQKLISGWRLCTKRLQSSIILATRCWPMFYGSGCVGYGLTSGLLA
jgi:hypothetical protein